DSCCPSSTSCSSAYRRVSFDDAEQRTSRSSSCSHLPSCSTTSSRCPSSIARIATHPIAIRRALPPPPTPVRTRSPTPHRFVASHHGTEIRRRDRGGTGYATVNSVEDRLPLRARILDRYRLS